MSKVTILPQVVNQTRVDPESDDGEWVCCWPALGFDAIDGLDYVTREYTRSFLLGAATTSGTDQMSLATSALLRDLADNPAALEELNKYRREVPASIRALNITLHYLASKELKGKTRKAALNHVADIWKMPKATVQDMHGERGDDAGRELELIVSRRVGREKFPIRHAVLAAIDADMQYRVPILDGSPRNLQIGRARPRQKIECDQAYCRARRDRNAKKMGVGTQRGRECQCPSITTRWLRRGGDQSQVAVSQ